MPKKQRQFIWSLLFFGGLIGLALLISQVRMAPTDPAVALEEMNQIKVTTALPSPSGSTGAPEITREPRLLALAETKTGKQLVTLDFETGARHVIFTDADERLKIKQVGTVSRDGSVLVVLGEPSDAFGGSLYTIATDGSGLKTLLLETFASPWPPILTMDGKKIVYIVFSNTQAATGFSLIVANWDGTNKRELVREERPMSQPVFSPDDTRVAYVIEETSGTSRIMSVPLAGGSSRTEVTVPGRIPYDLAWTAVDTFLFIDGTGSDANLYEMTTNTSEASRIVTPSGQESRPLRHPTAAAIVYTVTDAGTSQLTVLERVSGQVRSLGSGVAPIGWIR